MDTEFNTKIKHSLAAGARKGWAGFAWLLKILVPISLLTMLIQQSGALQNLNFLLEPVMGWLSLPPSAALPIITGALAGIYGGIAAMSMLPFTNGQMTLMAIFLLIAHNLVQEGIIQARSGIGGLRAVISRLAVAVVTVMVVARLLDVDPAASAAAAAPVAATTLAGALLTWASATLELAVKMFLIIVAVMIILETLKTFDLVPVVVRIFAPVLWLMGLNRRVGLLWLTAVIFGITYGGAVIVQEARRGSFSREEIESLHLSIGVNHSMIEDPALFLTLGLHPFWMWIPRLVAAVLIVHIARLGFKMVKTGKDSAFPDA